MPMYADELHQILQTAFPDAQVEVSGDDGVHMAAKITDASFKGKPRVAQHRMVYAALGDIMDGPAGALHALALTTATPD